MRTGLWRLAGALLCLALFLPGPAFAQPADGYAARLDRLQLLVRANLLDLAEQGLLTQPPPPESPLHERWQLQLAALYQSQGAWPKLLAQMQAVLDLSARSRQPPNRLAEKAELNLAEAYIALGDAPAARAVLRRALVAAEHSAEHRRRLRQKIITSYLAEDSLSALELSIEQFQNDYRLQDAEWRLLQARTLIRLGRPKQAVNLLAPLSTPHARLLGLYARVQSGELSAKALQKPLKQLGENAPDAFARPILAVQFAALRREERLAEAIKMLETYLAAQVAPNEPAGFSQYGRDDLRRLYAGFAAATAEKAGLAAGDPRSWFELAQGLPATTIRRRSLLAYLWLESDLEELRREAYDGFITAQLAAKNLALLARLLGDESDWERLPLSPKTVLALSNAALSEGYYPLAATALAGIEAPPDLFDTQWTLHAARIELLGGRSQSGIARLHAWAARVESLTPEEFDRALQPVFDLQRLDKHADALALFEQLARFAVTPQQRRQLPYWRAESHVALGENRIAAEQFLISALAAEGGYDLWGQAARHQAAEALIRAELYADARHLLLGLLNASDTPQRRRRLEQRLQSLLVLEAAAEPE